MGDLIVGVERNGAVAASKHEKDRTFAGEENNTGLVPPAVGMSCTIACAAAGKLHMTKASAAKTTRQTNSAKILFSQRSRENGYLVRCGRGSA
jgi:hypothetical protein